MSTLQCCLFIFSPTMSSQIQVSRCCNIVCWCHITKSFQPYSVRTVELLTDGIEGDDGCVREVGMLADDQTDQSFNCSLSTPWTWSLFLLSQLASCTVKAQHPSVALSLARRSRIRTYCETNRASIHRQCLTISKLISYKFSGKHLSGSPSLGKWLSREPSFRKTSFGESDCMGKRL